MSRQLKAFNFRCEIERAMRVKNAISSLLLLFFAISCKKTTDFASSQTILLLQNKWVLVSSNVIFPTNTSLNALYTGKPGDYYDFKSNDSLIIYQAGGVNTPSIPVNIITNYSLLNDNMLAYGINTNIHINIKTLTNNLLILTNGATASFTNANNTVTVYNGTKIDSFRR